MTMADRIAIMDKGEVMQVATPAEVYEAPASRFVANFVGNVNMFEGRVASRANGAASIDAGNGVTIQPTMPARRRPAPTCLAIARRRSGFLPPGPPTRQTPSRARSTTSPISAT